MILHLAVLCLTLELHVAKKNEIQGNMPIAKLINVIIHVERDL